MKRQSNFWKTHMSSLLSVIIILICVYLVYEYWDLLGENEAGSATLRNLAIVVTAAIGLPFVIIRSLVPLRSLLDERYQKSAEMLGSEILAVRIGGIVGLWHVAYGSPQTHHIQTMRVLCAFIRNWQDIGLTKANQQHGLLSENLPLPMAREDVREAMLAIIFRSAKQVAVEKESGYKLELYNADLTNLVLSRGNLSGGHLWGANLSRAVLRGVDLSGALMTLAIFSDTDLTGANLSGAEGLTASQLAGAKAEEENPPILTHARDCNTGKPLVWCGENYPKQYKG